MVNPAEANGAGPKLTRREIRAHRFGKPGRAESKFPIQKDVLFRRTSNGPLSRRGNNIGYPVEI